MLAGALLPGWDVVAVGYKLLLECGCGWTSCCCCDINACCNVRSYSAFKKRDDISMLFWLSLWCWNVMFGTTGSVVSRTANRWLCWQVWHKILNMGLTRSCQILDRWLVYSDTIDCEMRNSRLRSTGMIVIDVQRKKKFCQAKYGIAYLYTPSILVVRFTTGTRY